MPSIIKSATNGRNLFRALFHKQPNSQPTDINSLMRAKVPFPIAQLSEALRQKQILLLVPEKGTIGPVEQLVQIICP